MDFVRRDLKEIVALLDRLEHAQPAEALDLLLERIAFAFHRAANLGRIYEELAHVWRLPRRSHDA